MAKSHALVWFRTDLRIKDNPALHHACEIADKVTAVFFTTPEQWKSHNLSNYRMQFTYQALEHLGNDLGEIGIELLVINTKNFKSLEPRFIRLCEEINCQHVFFNYEYAWDELQRDKAIIARCEDSHISVKRFNANLIIPPGKVLTQQGQPFKVFTPFKRTWLQTFSNYDRKPLAAPLTKWKKRKSNLSLVTNEKLLANWPASSAKAEDRLQHFIKNTIRNYDQDRDFPNLTGTSTLSPYLALGLLSPLSALQAARYANNGELNQGNKGIATWINELIWREFYIHLMVAFPDVCKFRPLKPDTEKVAWRSNKKEFEKWCNGETGFPLVDAAMKQLNTTGWMHNRLRMVTATFLSKYLLIDWRWGEQYFMEHLVDGHLAANNGGWQWSASTGTDAAPYFRLLSPVRQAERFDPDGEFIKRFIPALKELPGKIIHKPGHPDLLKTGYPKPMVDLKLAKDRCLAAFKQANY